MQYDFVMPKRFDLSYVDREGKNKQPVVIHRSSIGALERTMAFLIEKYAGAFPVWLSPVQVIVVPITDRHHKYAYKIKESLAKESVRVEVDDRSLSMQKKLKEAEEQKIPFMLIIGDKEVSNQTVSVRQRGQKDLGSIKLVEFSRKICLLIEKKAQI